MARLKTFAREVCPPFLWKLAYRARQRLTPVQAVPKTPLIFWMGFINPGMFSDENLALFDYCIRHLPNEAPIIEIGSFAGKSLNHLILLLRRAGRANPVFSVDDWKFGGMIDWRGEAIEGLVPLDAYRAHVIDTFEKNARLSIFQADSIGVLVYAKVGAGSSL
jgi:hypothetical protein